MKKINKLKSERRLNDANENLEQKVEGNMIEKNEEICR